ncbi:hypothetical protein GEMRC1_003923 [Eukaryota sp. GEM-RC1]
MKPLPNWIPFLTDGSHQNVRRALKTRSLSPNKGEPLYIVVSTHSFRQFLTEQLIPDFADGHSAAAVIKLFHNFFTVFNQCNVYFVFYHTHSLFKPHYSSDVDVEAHDSGSGNINIPQKLPTAFLMDVYMLWSALAVNDPNTQHANKVQFIPRGNLNHHIAKEVQQNESYAAFSPGFQFFFHQHCRAVFFKIGSLKSLYDQLCAGREASFWIFDQTRFLSFDKIVAFLTINHSGSRELWDEVKSASKRPSTYSYVDIVNYLESDDDNLTKWNEFLANNPDEAAEASEVHRVYAIPNDLFEPVTFTNPLDVDTLLHYKIQPKNELVEPLFDMDMKFFDLPGARRHYGVILKYAVPSIQFLRSVHHVRQSNENFPISDECQNFFDLVLAPEHRQLLLEGSRSPVEMLLSIIESFSNHPNGNEWSTPDIHSSWIQLFEEVSEVENTVFLLFLVIRYFNQRRLFLDGVCETSPKVSFVDVVLMAISFTFPLGGYSFGEAGRDKYYDSVVGSKDNYKFPALLSAVTNYFINLFDTFEFSNVSRHLALFNSRIFVFLSEILSMPPSTVVSTESEVLSVLETKNWQFI